MNFRRTGPESNNMPSTNAIDVVDLLGGEIQKTTLHSIYLTNQYDDEVEIIHMPLSATKSEALASPVGEESEDELRPILLQSPFRSAPVPSLDWLQTCLEEMETNPEIDLTSEHPTSPHKYTRLRRSARGPMQAEFIDFTKDCVLKSRLNELRINAQTPEEKKELDDLEAILGCHGATRPRRNRRSKKLIRKNPRALSYLKLAI